MGISKSNNENNGKWENKRIITTRQDQTQQKGGGLVVMYRRCGR